MPASYFSGDGLDNMKLLKLPCNNAVPHNYYAPVVKEIYGNW
jgi:hypothetical protein